MNLKTAAALLPCYRSGKTIDPKICKAVAYAENHATLRTVLSDQMDFDEQIVNAIHAIRPPDDLRQKLTEFTTQSAATRKSVRRLFNPAVLAVAMGLLLIVGIFVFLEMESRADFPGKDAVEKLIEVTAGMNGTELEPTNMPAGQLGDAVYMKGFDGFTLPPEFTTLPAIGWRVFRHQGHRVAQLAVDRHNALILVLRASDFGIQMGQNDDWRLFTHEDWVGAAKHRGDICTIVVFRGNQPEMQQFLKSPTP